MAESDPEQPDSDWPKGLIVNVAVSIAIANYGGNFAKYYDGQKGSLLFIAGKIISVVKRALQSGKDLDDHSVRKKVAIEIDLGKATHLTEEYWLSRAKEIISDVASAFLAQPVEGESTDERYSS